jgi:hypothetical protein
VVPFLARYLPFKFLRRRQSEAYNPLPRLAENEIDRLQRM